MQLQVAAYSARSCRLQTSDGGSLSGRGGSARGLRELIGYRAEIVDGVANLGRVRVRVRVRIGVGVRVRVRVGVRVRVRLRVRVRVRVRVIGGARAGTRCCPCRARTPPGKTGVVGV